ncbi:MAG: hypothetical protein ACXW3K_08380 [Brevundimonas sp.]
MSAAALPRQTGLKRLAGALAFVCLMLLLLVIENRHAVGAWRALRDEVAPAAGGVVDGASRLLSGAADGFPGLNAALADPEVVAADPGDAILAGEYDPTNEVTRVVTGAVVFVGGEVRFEAGQIFHTRPLRIAAGREAFARRQTFAERLAAPGDAQIELRLIVPVAPDQALEPSPLCAGAAPALVALLHRRDRVDVMLFREPAVGPDAPPAALCGAWSFRKR